MQLSNNVRGLWNYLVWQRQTRDLCHAGKDITHVVNNAFPTLDQQTIISFIRGGDFLELTPDLQAPLNLRKSFWLSRRRKDLVSKLASYPSILAKRFEQYRALGDSCSAFGVFVWLHSTVDIASSALEAGMIAPEQHRALTDKIETLAEKGVRYFQDEAEGRSASGVYHDGILESNTGYVVRHLAHNLKNIFRVIEPDQRTFFLEVFEKWDFGKRRITVCVPISIGCPNRCHQCNFGAWVPYRRPLTANEIFNLIYTNAIINDDVTSLFFRPEQLIMYYLGGGDPGDNIPEIERLLQRVHQFYYAERALPFVEWIRRGSRLAYPFQQVVSTIGIDNGSLDRLIDLAGALPELGLQVSVSAFDEEARAHMIRHPRRVLSIEQCVRATERFYDVTANTNNPRKAYLSIFLLDGVYDNSERIMQDIKKLNIDGRRCHITLDILKHTPEQFPYQAAPVKRYQSLQRRLRRAGYSASIYYPPEDNATQEGCGVVSTYLLQRIDNQERQFSRFSMQ